MSLTSDNKSLNTKKDSEILSNKIEKLNFLQDFHLKEIQSTDPNKSERIKKSFANYMDLANELIQIQTANFEPKSDCKKVEIIQSDSTVENQKERTPFLEKNVKENKISNKLDLSDFRQSSKELDSFCSFRKMFIKFMSNDKLTESDFNKFEKFEFESLKKVILTSYKKILDISWVNKLDTFNC